MVLPTSERARPSVTRALVGGAARSLVRWWLVRPPFGSAVKPHTRAWGPVGEGAVLGAGDL